MDHVNIHVSLAPISILSRETLLEQGDRHIIAEFINRAGMFSALAQNLRKPITTFEKLV